MARIRQQPTTRNRRALTRGTLGTPPNIIWTPVAVSGPVLECEIENLSGSYSIHGVVRMVMPLAGQQATAMQVIPSPGPGIPDKLLVTFAVDILAGQVFQVEQWDPALRNSQGGTLSPATQGLPAGAAPPAPVEWEKGSTIGLQTDIDVVGGLGTLGVQGVGFSTDNGTWTVLAVRAESDTKIWLTLDQAPLAGDNLIYSFASGPIITSQGGGLISKTVVL